MFLQCFAFNEPGSCNRADPCERSMLNEPVAVYIGVQQCSTRTLRMAVHRSFSSCSDIYVMHLLPNNSEPPRCDVRFASYSTRKISHIHTYIHRSLYGCRSWSGLWEMNSH